MTGYKAAQHVILAFLVLGVFTSESRAVLLAEVGISIPPTFDPSPPPDDFLVFSFGVLSHSPTLVGGEWQRQVTAADIGMSFEAPPNVVEVIAPGLTRPAAEVGINMDSWGYGNTLDQLQAGAWAECCEIVTFRKFVPDITKVPVNRLTMTIDSFHFERLGGVVPRANIGGGHTIRIYGVPEPSAGILTSAGLWFYYRRCRR
jgi:hypothetical protein